VRSPVIVPGLQNQKSAKGEPHAGRIEQGAARVWRHQGKKRENQVSVRSEFIEYLFHRPLLFAVQMHAVELSINRCVSFGSNGDKTLDGYPDDFQFKLNTSLFSI
jgi:hypothetical protein